ncbi:MAG: HAD family phosphatase [Nanoarchaeota archaeon]
MIKAIIFDYGGVVATTDYSVIEWAISQCKHKEKAEQVMNELLVPFEKGKITNIHFWNEFSRKTGLELPKDYRNLWINSYRIKSIQDKSMLNLIKRLKARGYKTILLSNTIEPNASFNRKNGCYSLFNPVILSCSVGLMKPDKRIYSLALDKAGLKASECIFVDDTPRNIFPAREIGMFPIHFRNSVQLEEDLKSMGLKF